MAVVYSGDATLIMQQAADKGMNFGYCLPKEGSNIFMDNLSIVKGTEHMDEAMAFLDYMCRPDIVARNSEYIGYAPPEQAAYEQLSDDLKSIPSFYPTDEERERLVAYRDLGDFNAKYEDAWLRVKAE